MPSVPRPNKKMQKIAFNIMGTPPALRSDKSSEKKQVDERLVYEETNRAK